eukprot:TRINITY_DN9111_c0_g1_i6.p1 TRINITY_DN9111_c0_g1~~TRINITY_DN9111_c0_g1_i6.p1  ORF type:complete len:851 (+),score=50.29 TRINITY_DN9111_c0_g1_i6:33-2555(+)
MEHTSRSEPLPYSRKTLHFKTAEVEAAFVRSRSEQLYKSFLVGSVLLVLFAAGSVTSAFVTEKWLWSASPGAAKIFYARIILMGSTCVCCILVIGLLSLLPSNSCIRSGVGLETVISAAACLVSVVVVMMHPWNLGNAILNEPVTYMYLINDDKLLLDLDVWLTAVHILLPIRFPFLVAINVVSFTSYCVVIVVLGAQSKGTGYATMNIALLSVLILSLAWGKRSFEILERTTFVRIVRERTLRYEAEHKLSSQSRSKNTPREPDSASLGASLFTAELFDLRAEGSIDEKLEGIIECGTKEHWIIAPEELRPVNDGFISNGGFGMVLLAYYHGVEVAVKVPRISTGKNSLRTLRSMASELRIFRRLHHPHIVAFHGACIDLASANIALVLEFVRGMPLRTASSDVPTTPTAMSERLLWADNVCAAIVYLHAQKPSIVHSDIKDTNVLVEQAGNRRMAKLLDFGLSKLLTSPNLAIGGTVPWMAPEVLLRGQNSATTKLDVFSFGRLFYKIVTGRAPLEGMSATEIKASARAGSIPTLQWPSSMLLLPECASLCDACLLWDMGARPDMIDVQTRLRALCLRGDVPDDFKEALRKAFPHRMSSQDLHSVFAKVQRSTLWHDAFAETPSRYRILSIRAAICRWNVSVQNSCCILHARLRALEEAANGLQPTQCRDISHMYDSQCQICGLLNDGKCDVCNSSDQVLSSARREHPHLASIDEEVPIERGDSIKVEQQIQPLRTLIHDAFVETPWRTRSLSITVASLHWNIPISESCCVEHARRRALESVLRAMQTTTCASPQTEYEWQCQSCGALGDGTCDWCSGSGENSEPESLEPDQAEGIEA